MAKNKITAKKILEFLHEYENLVKMQIAVFDEVEGKVRKNTAFVIKELCKFIALRISQNEQQPI